jgi:hypothetical protein
MFDPFFMGKGNKRGGKKDVRRKKEICGICGFLYPVPVQIITHKSFPYDDAFPLDIMVLQHSSTFDPLFGPILYPFLTPNPASPPTLPS